MLLVVPCIHGPRVTAVPVPGAELTKLKIHHPGRVVGQIILKLTMPGTLGRVLSGYNPSLKRAGRVERCRLEDRPTVSRRMDWGPGGARRGGE